LQIDGGAADDLSTFVVAVCCSRVSSNSRVRRLSTSAIAASRASASSRSRLEWSSCARSSVSRECLRRSTAGVARRLSVLRRRALIDLPPVATRRFMKARPKAKMVSNLTKCLLQALSWCRRRRAISGSWTSPRPRCRPRHKLCHQPGCRPGYRQPRAA
jgi:hypothetical protein